MNYSLYIDDVRTPRVLVNCKIARSFDEACQIVTENGCPDFISFDHDLGDGVPTGFDFAKWFVEMDLDKNIDIQSDFMYNVHSSNPPGSVNIKGYLDSYLNQKFGRSL